MVAQFSTGILAHFSISIYRHVHPQTVSARSCSLFHECPHSVQMFVPSALLMA